MVKAQKSWFKHKDTPKYKVEDQVWLEGRYLRTNQTNHEACAQETWSFQDCPGDVPCQLLPQTSPSQDIPSI